MQIVRLLSLLILACAAGAQSRSLRGLVADSSEAPVPEAAVRLESAAGSLLEQARTGQTGDFHLKLPPAGSYVLRVSTRGFTPLAVPISLDSAGAVAVNLQSNAAAFDETAGLLRLRMSPAGVSSEITVTASRGAVEEASGAAHLVTVRDREMLTASPMPTLGHSLQQTPGITVQETTPGQVSPFLRGLTGYQTLILIDGVRFNTSTFRSGPNQYLAYVDPAQTGRVEALLGPTGSTFGSDSLGGTLHVITRQPAFSSHEGIQVFGEAGAFGSSGDSSRGADAQVAIGTNRLSWLAGGTGRRHGQLRGGGGEDSHNAFARFFGLSQSQIGSLLGSRMRGTGFDQYGFHTKFAARLRDDQNLSVWYQRTELEGVQNYKDLMGGLGRLESRFDPQGLQFFYTRYEKLNLGFLDSLSGTFSVNSQSDGSTRQGLRSIDSIIREDNRVDSIGYSLQGTSHLGSRGVYVFGLDAYNERIRSDRGIEDPRTQTITQTRGLSPNGSRYNTYGLFGQVSGDLVRGRLRGTLGGRFTAVNFRTFADRNLDAQGRNLGVADARQTFRDLTFNSGLAWQALPALTVNVLVGRGFRAPNVTDLSTIGLSDLGYEVPAEEAVRYNALLANSASEGALSTGKPLNTLRAERLFNYEAGVKFQVSKLYARVHVFDAELMDPIVRRTMLFPVASLPQALSGIPVTPLAPTPQQAAQGVAGVATALDPRAVKAFVNDGHTRYYGAESLVRYHFSSQWSAEVNYTFLAGRDLNPNRNVRRLPPQQGMARLRYVPSGRRIWLELTAYAAGAQERLSGGDIDDERIGASRRRSDIASFFRGGLVEPYLGPGADGASGTADDVFRPTGETLPQISQRVLPLGTVVNGVRIADDNSRAPMFLTTPGWLAFDLRAGIPLTESMSLNAGLMNLLDRNYRIHGSGIDSPGRSAFLGVRYRF